MRFDLADLSLFRHVVEAGSITGGAERAHLALAAASTRIRNMVKALCASLLVVARDHALAERTRIPFGQVLEHDFVGLDRASARQRLLADKAARIGQPLRLRVQLRSCDAVCRMGECNVGFGIVPETTARRVAKTMAIVPVALTDAWAVRELTICIRNLGELPPFAR